MDGLDGLVAGCMFVVIATGNLSINPLVFIDLGGLSTWFSCLELESCEGFMGDVGSTFLGALFAGLVLQAPSWSPSLAFRLVAAPLLGDAFVCVIRRQLAGHNVFEAHRLHLFQRLHQSGWSHSRVSLLYIGATAVHAMALIFGGLPLVFTFSILGFLVGVGGSMRCCPLLCCF